MDNFNTHDSCIFDQLIANVCPVWMFGRCVVNSNWKLWKKRKTTALLRNHQKHRVCSDPCICTTQRYSFFSSEVLHKIWRIFPRSFDLTSLSNILYKTKQKAVSFLLATSSVSRDLSCMTSISLPHGVSLFGNIERCVVVSFSGPTYIHESDVEHALCAFSGFYWEYF